MIFEIISIIAFVQGLLLVIIGLMFLTKDVHEYVNQLLATSLVLLGLVSICYSATFYAEWFLLFADYLMYLAYPVGTALFFVTGITIIKGERTGKSWKLLLPVFAIATLPFLLQLLLGPPTYFEEEVLGETFLNTVTNPIVETAFLFTYILFLFGGIFYFLETYAELTGLARFKIQHFIIGMGMMGFFTIVVSLTYLLEMRELANIVLLTILPLGFTVGSIIIIRGMTKKSDVSTSIPGIPATIGE
ncbi:MAG: hypothetical protein ACFFD4_26190 [Candidatus Odinarchaeota archaeon]